MKIENLQLFPPASTTSGYVASPPEFAPPPPSNLIVSEQPKDKSLKSKFQKKMVNFLMKT